jgi:AmmeMemoRadiSam system protein A
MSRLFETSSAKLPENPSAHAPVQPLPEFSLAQRQILLGIAHRAILSAFDRGSLPVAPPSSPLLSELRGIFSTLYLDGQLRGCVGYALPIVPLYRAVAETARAAAFEDSRFLPVTIEEVPRLEVSLSVLSRLFPIRAEAVEVGRHGLLISQGAHRGLLLPQVPVEHAWDQGTFLEQTCRKAGLPPNVWRAGSGITIEAFTAEIFRDRESGNSDFSANDGDRNVEGSR